MSPIRTVRGAGCLLLLGALASCAPKDIVRTTCTTEMLAVGDPNACTLTGEVVGRASSLTFDTESRNLAVQVKASMRVKKGTLRVRYFDLKSVEQTVDVTPEHPLEGEWQSRLKRDTRSFPMYFEPVGGAVEGLTGTVTYQAL